VTRCFDLFLFLVLALFHSTLFADWSGKWDSKGSDAIIGLSTDPQNPDAANNAFLIIGYSRKFGCIPVVSVLILKGQSLGSPYEQKTSKSKKNQLVVTVGSREFTGETKFTKYTNGAELAMQGSQAIIDALSNGNAPILAKVGATSLLNFARASEFNLANQKAEKNCN